MALVLQVELGLKKELREMLPIIVYKESFSVRDTQSVAFFVKILFIYLLLFSTL